ncbi:MAG: 23S rRNA (adenine(2503)-C(2))-methyltransferase RlmN [Chloroflexi bacterium]|nr:23S rRNA (adenine(2503)-C(2))-methyltransferase RlmN [Chloroflexota bacterium]
MPGKPVRLLDLTFEQTEGLLADWGEPKFRAQQLWTWLYRDTTAEAERMHNLPRALRDCLANETVIELLTPVVELTSSDGYTQKWLFRLPDGQTIETVLMGYSARRTVCISTQVGCAMACPFCATGQAGFTRNLTSGEIIAQVLFAARRLTTHSSLANLPDLSSRRGVTNVVFMGMGEPMVNYQPMWQAVERLTDPRGFGLGARHITISTVGIIAGIEKFANEGSQVNLAVSLHAADDELRNRLVPVNKRFPIASLLKACRDYQAVTKRRVTFEYALISGVNDSLTDARRLARLLRGLIAHVNLIPLNPTAGSALKPTPRTQVRAFRQELEVRGVPATVRIGRGLDINAGCGQLREIHARDVTARG